MRLAVIIAIGVIEIISRLLLPFLPIDALTYTLFVRIIQILVIMLLAFEESGVQTPLFTRELFFGCVIAFVFGALVFAGEGISKALFKTGVISSLIGTQHVKNPTLFLFSACIIGPFAEELFFRGLLYAWLRQAFSVIFSVILSSVLFASLHGAFGLIPLIGGVMLALIFEWRKNIWPCFIVHALANIGIWQFSHILALLTQGKL